MVTHFHRYSIDEITKEGYENGVPEAMIGRLVTGVSSVENRYFYDLSQWFSTHSRGRLIRKEPAFLQPRLGS